MIRTISFVVIVMIALAFSPLWSIPFIVWHMLRYDAYEFLLFAICIDVYFGAGMWPYYTGATIFGLLVIICVRPYITFFDSV